MPDADVSAAEDVTPHGALVVSLTERREAREWRSTASIAEHYRRAGRRGVAQARRALDRARTKPGVAAGE